MKQMVVSKKMKNKFDESHRADTFHSIEITLMSNDTTAQPTLTIHAFTPEARTALRALEVDHYEWKMLLREDDFSDHAFNEMTAAKQMMVALESGHSIEVNADWFYRWAFDLAQQDRKDLWLRK